MKRSSLVFTFLLSVSAAHAAPMGEKGGAVSAEEAKQIATDAYVFLYPLVTMDLTEKVSTAAPKPGSSKAPINQFGNLRSYPEASNHSVTAPNADTLYSQAWLDLSQGPIVFSHPDMGKRFYLFPILDAYTNVVRTPSARDDGGAAATYVLTGPDWQGGEIPAGATEIKVPTNMAWILGRTYSTGTPQDYAEVHGLQDQYKLGALAGAPGAKAQGKAGAKVDTKTAVRDQIDALKGDEFFRRGAALMAANPPANADATIVEQMARIGLAPGKPFETSRLPKDVAAAIAAAPRAGQERIKDQLQKGVTKSNGWLVTTKAGTYGTDYDQRAFITAIGLGANVPEQAIYPVAETDRQGQKLNGENQYVIRFPAGQTPPAKAFWSITMYTPQMFFYENPERRYTVSSRTPFHKNADGSIDVYVQHDKPSSAEQEPNWLPAPAGGFALMMRLYWPETKKPSILDGSWAPPAVTRVGEKTARTGHTPRRPVTIGSRR
jgi:hypothetical protein